MRWWKLLLRWWRGVDKTPPVVTSPPVVSEPPVVTEISRNRHDRRALDRARRKYDKFVTPKGVLPEQPKLERQPRPRKKKIEVVVPDAVEIDDAEIHLADSHHENRNDLVAYKEAEMYGEFNFRDTILQQLEYYFVYLERMRRRDPDAYGLYRQVGATVLPYLATGSWNRDAVSKPGPVETTPLADWFNATRPTFGCFVYGADPETERHEKTSRRPELQKADNRAWVPKFMYFRKHRQSPPWVQQITGGDVYIVTVWWDKPFDKRVKAGTPQEFAIFVSVDGKQVLALKRHEYTRKAIWSKRKHETFHVPQSEWGFGEFACWARDNGEDTQHFLTELFKDAVHRTEMAQYSMTRISATKGSMTAVFSVNIHRTSYFFQDRDIHIGEAGSRKRIFHFVRPHVRRDGTEVKAHFRGEREFTWAGYDIKITIPGRDHLIIADFNVNPADSDVGGDGLLDMPQVGEKMKRWVDTGVGKRA